MEMDTFITVFGYFLVVILGVYVLIDAHTSRKKKREAAAVAFEPQPPLNPTDMGQLIGRIGMMEGQIIALKTSIDQLQSMGARIAGVEAQLPTVADAYEKYTSVLSRLEKRVSTRDQREAQRETKTLGEAASELFPAGPAPDEPKANGAPRAGILGSGGSRR